MSKNNHGKNICIIGDGGWGTALALVLHGNGHNVTVWGPFPDYISKIRQTGENESYLPGIKLPSTLKWTSDRKDAAAGADRVARLYLAENCVEVCAVVIQQTPCIMHDLLDVLDLLLEHTQRGRIGQHQAGQVLVAMLAESVKINVAARIGWDRNNFHAAHG